MRFKAVKYSRVQLKEYFMCMLWVRKTAVIDSSDLYLSEYESCKGYLKDILWVRMADLMDMF